MKKPDRKEFRREHGPRAPMKFAAAMQKYRKFQTKQKSQKTTGIGPVSDGAKYGRQIAKPTGVGPVRSGAEYGRNLQKERQAKTPQPKPEQAKPKQTAKPEQAKPKQTAKPVVKSSKGNTGTGRDGKFGSGTYGDGRKPDGKPKPKAKHRGGSRAKAGENRKTTSIQDVIKNVDNMFKLTHKKGDTKKIGNSTYRWNGQRWVKINRPF